MTSGISNAGRSAEDEFRRLTGALPTDAASSGDALLEGHPVEIKKASTKTINQVRAVKYIPLVVLDVTSGTWYVVPPDEVVRFIARQRRGQHTENPFKSATLSLSTLSGFAVAHPDQLRQATLNAIAQGDAWSELEGVMHSIRDQARELAANSIHRVQEILERGAR